MNQNTVAKFTIALLSVVVLGLVFLMYSGFGIKSYFNEHYPQFNKSVLPYINALINCSVFIILLLAYRAIRQKNILVHRRYMYAAATLSTLFLLNYVFYHMISKSTSYGGDGLLRYVYFFILLTHVLLAIVSLPFILYTAFLGQTMQVDNHRRLARFVWPVWLYVALTGVLVYILISPYYPTVRQ